MVQFLKTFLISAHQPVFAGHFPGRPILPGVLFLAFARETLSARFGQQVRIARIIRQRFHTPVVPTQALRVECDVGTVNTEGHRVTCRFVNQNDELAAKADLIVKVGA